MAVNYENLPGAGSAPRPADYPNVRDFPVAGPLDATLPPTPIRELLAASGATVFVLATDANFISTIRRAAEQHPLFVVETWPDLVEAVEAGRCGIALLDATLLGSRVSQCVARLAVYHEAPMENLGLMRMVNRSDGAVQAVVINGRVAFSDGRVDPRLGHERGFGQFLPAAGSSTPAAVVDAA